MIRTPSGLTCLDNNVPNLPISSWSATRATAHGALVYFSIEFTLGCLYMVDGALKCDGFEYWKRFVSALGITFSLPPPSGS